MVPLCRVGLIGNYKVCEHPSNRPSDPPNIDSTITSYLHAQLLSAAWLPLPCNRLLRLHSTIPVVYTSVWSGADWPPRTLRHTLFGAFFGIYKHGVDTSWAGGLALGERGGVLGRSRRNYVLGLRQPAWGR